MLRNALIAHLQILLKGIIIIIYGNEPFVSSAECNLVIPIIPPATHCGAVDDVAELDHVCNLAPTMLADPSVSARFVRIDSR